MILSAILSPVLSGVARGFAAHWFLICLAAALVVGAMGSDWVMPVANLAGMRSAVVAGVLFLMGITLRSTAIEYSLRHPRGGLVALGINILGVPAMAATVAPLLPAHLGGGLIVAAAVPCTLASASVWTRRGNGNDAISMLVTVVTNLFCFAIAPTTLLLLLGRAVEIGFAQQSLQLVMLVVMPLVVAQMLRRSTAIAARVDRHKRSISMVAQGGILVMVVFGMAETAQRVDAVPSGAGVLILVGGLAVAIHVVALIGGWWIGGAIGLARGDRVAVAVAGSQKTLMVGLQLAIDCGVSMLPMILYHVGQLVIDTLFVGRPQVRGQSSVGSPDGPAADEGGSPGSGRGADHDHGDDR